MRNFVWSRDVQESMDNPFEHEAQDQCLRESITIIKRLRSDLISKNTLQLNKNNLKKAILMLSINSLDSMHEILGNLVLKKHRVVAHLLRTIDESIDLAEYFLCNDPESNKNLEMWFKNEIISHGTFRNYIKKKKGDKEFENQREYYRQISKFNHNTYKTLLYSYCIGSNEEIIHESKYDSGLLIPIKTIAMYTTMSAKYVLFISNKLAEFKLIDPLEILITLSESQEVDTVPRRFQRK